MLAGLGVDHRWSVSDMGELKPGFTQGNFDQSLLFLPENEFLLHLNLYLERMYKDGPPLGWVSGLGHGILPKTPESNVRLFVKTVREFRK
jgi:uroporphyrinogen decarboxylase